MTYQVVLVRNAQRDLKKLDRVAQKRIKNALIKFSQNPLFYAKKLTDREIGNYRFRVGNHRIIFDIEQNRIVILRIGHRREIYR